MRNTSNICTIFAAFKYDFHIRKTSIENKVLMNLKNKIFKLNTSFDKIFKMTDVNITQCISRQIINFLSEQNKFLCLFLRLLKHCKKKKYICD